jgi:hypothetical protein
MPCYVTYGSGGKFCNVVTKSGRFRQLRNGYDERVKAIAFAGDNEGYPNAYSRKR